MSMFILSQNGKVGVYGIGDRVIGSAGTEKALIMDGATNTIVDNTVEEIHLQNNIENLSFAVDENTNTVSIMNGNSVVASFAANETGIKLFTANGMSVIKMSLDDQGNASFTADNGTTGSTPVTLPTNGSALPTEAIDTNAKSENAGGTTPTPPVTEEGILVEVAAAGLANGTYKGGDYILDDNVAHLNDATYAVINGAKSITVADTVKNLKADDAANALALASNVSVEDGLKNLALNDPFDFGGKPTTLLVTSAPVSNSKLNLGDVTVAEASGAQAKIDAFIARTDVTYADGVKKPTSVTVSDYNIVDDATNLNAGDAVVIAQANKVTVEDTVANIATISTATFADVDAVNVSDSLLNISQANEKLVDEIAGKKFDGKDAYSFVATDTTEATMFFGGNFGGSNEPTIDVSKLTGDKASMTIMLDADESNAITPMKLDLKTENPFGTTLSSKVDLNIVGSKYADEITLTDIKNDTVIDGGLGNDVITLGDGADTVVLGTGITKAGDYGSGLSGDASVSAVNKDSITGFNIKETASGIDKIDFADFLEGFDNSDYMTLASASDGISGSGFNGKIVKINESLASADFVKLFATAGVGEGDDMIIIAADSTTNINIWYVADTTVDGKIEQNEIHLVANLDGAIADFSDKNIA